MGHKLAVFGPTQDAAVVEKVCTGAQLSPLYDTFEADACVELTAHSLLGVQALMHLT